MKTENRKKEEPSFDRKAYQEKLQTNRMIGILLSFAGMALAVIFYVLSHALR